MAIPQLAVDLPGMPANMNGGARLRFVMEDPAQLLSNAVASYIIDHLCANGNQPTDVFNPGFTNVAYPARQDAPRRLE